MWVAAAPQLYAGVLGGGSPPAVRTRLAAPSSKSETRTFMAASVGLAINRVNGYAQYFPGHFSRGGLPPPPDPPVHPLRGYGGYGPVGEFNFAVETEVETDARPEAPPSSFSIFAAAAGRGPKSRRAAAPGRPQKLKNNEKK